MSWRREAKGKAEEVATECALWAKEVLDASTKTGLSADLRAQQEAQLKATEQAVQRYTIQRPSNHLLHVVVEGHAYDDGTGDIQITIRDSLVSRLPKSTTVSGRAPGDG